MKLIIVALGICLSINANATDDSISNGEIYVAGQYIVKLSKSDIKLSNEQIEKLLEVKIVKRLSKQSRAVLVKSNKSNILASLNKNSKVEFAEPNYIYSINKLPDDTNFDLLWGLKNIGQLDSDNTKGKPGFDINLEAAWDITTGSKNTVIAVVDTGVDYTLSDLKNNMWKNQKEANGKVGIDDDGNGYIDDIHGYDFVNDDGDPIDDNRHGTHVAGTIAAEGNNKTDVSGVAWKANIMALKFLNARGRGNAANAILALDYATSMGANLTNNSWGNNSYSEALSEAIKRAKNNNILFVGSAGNASSNNDIRMHYPSGYEHENVVAVAAIDNTGSKPLFSNWGKTKVDIAAPGHNIVSTTPSGLVSLSGTSMAAPHVSGAVVLLLSQYPKLSSAEIRKRLIRTARPIVSMTNKVVSNGLLDVHALLENKKHPPNPNDPSNWQTSLYSYSTKHPYEGDLNQEHLVELNADVKEFALYFDKFELEKSYDKLTIINAKGVVVAELSGDHSESFSPVIQGNTVRLVLTTDSVVNRYGFDINKIAFRK